MKIKICLFAMILAAVAAYGQLVVKNPAQQQLLRVHESGNVVIGDSDVDPGEKLLVMGNVSAKSGAAPAGNAGLVFSQGTDDGLFHPGPDQLSLAVGGNEQLRITADGSIGITTSNPVTDLTVRESEALPPLTDARLAYTVPEESDDPALILGSDAQNYGVIMQDSTDKLMTGGSRITDYRYLRLATTSTGNKSEHDVLIFNGAMQLGGVSGSGQGDLQVRSGAVRIEDLNGSQTRYLTADEDGRLGTTDKLYGSRILAYCNLRTNQEAYTINSWDWLKTWNCTHDPESIYNSSDGYWQVPYSGHYKLWLYAQYQNTDQVPISWNSYKSYKTRYYWGNDWTNLTEYHQVDQGEWAEYSYQPIAMMQPQNIVIVYLNAGDYVRIRTRTNNGGSVNLRRTLMSIVYLGS